MLQHVHATIIQLALSLNSGNLDVKKISHALAIYLKVIIFACQITKPLRALHIAGIFVSTTLPRIVVAVSISLGSQRTYQNPV